MTKKELKFFRGVKDQDENWLAQGVEDYLFFRGQKTYHKIGGVVGWVMVVVAIISLFLFKT